MPFALKSACGIIAPIIGAKERALYRYQRKLEAEGGVFPSLGRGTGRGVRATPRNLAKLLIAILCAVDRRPLSRLEVLRLETARRTSPKGGEVQGDGDNAFRAVRPAIGEPTFGRALEVLMSDVGAVAIVESVRMTVEVIPVSGQAVIFYRHAPTKAFVTIKYGRRRLNYPPLAAVHRLEGNVFGMIIVALHQARQRKLAGDALKLGD